MRRVMIFIDGSNIFHSMLRYAKHIDDDNFGIDYERHVNLLRDENDLIRTYYFASTKIPPVMEQEKFYKALKKGLHFETIILPFKHGKEKGVDVSLAIYFLAFGLNNAYDEGILVTGDKDLRTAVEFVKQKGKYVKVVSFKHSLADELESVADECILIDDISKKIKK